MTTAETLGKRAARRYGWRPGVEHDLFTEPYLIDRLNEILADFARESGGFREEMTLDLKTVSAHPLSGRVIRLIGKSVRIDYDGDGEFGLEVGFKYEEELRHLYGPLENYDASSPSFYYTQRGNLADAAWQLMLFPASDTARADGIKFWARTSAPVLTAIGDKMPLQQNEEHLILPGFCVAFAETELSRGDNGAGAKLQYWAAAWEKSKEKMVDIVEDGLRAERRSVIYLSDDYGDDFSWAY